MEINNDNIMTNNSIIPEEIFASVIDGVATAEERRLVYKAIENDNELKEKFNECMYVKVFEKEIEDDFQTRYAGQSFELELEPEQTEKPEQKSLFNNIFLSIDNLTIDSDSLKKNLKQ